MVEAMPIQSFNLTKEGYEFDKSVKSFSEFYPEHDPNVKTSAKFETSVFGQCPVKCHSSITPNKHVAELNWVSLSNDNTKPELDSNTVRKNKVACLTEISV